MKLSPACKKIYRLWRRGWDIRISHKKRYAYLSGPWGEFMAVRYRDALKTIARRNAEIERRAKPAKPATGRI